MKSYKAMYKTFCRAINALFSLARAGFWIDRLWQQMQRHQVFAEAFAS